MGPSLDLALRRMQPAGPDLQREAMKQPKLTKKKVRLQSVHVRMQVPVSGGPMMDFLSPWRSAVPRKGVATAALRGTLLRACSCPCRNLHVRAFAWVGWQQCGDD
jgi:hypothetical protein